MPETMTCLTVWKRFNDVKQLHRHISQRHRELHLRGTVPPTTTDSNTFFRRFDPDVIQLRRAYILTLLDFIAQHPALYKSHAFKQFFESSQSPKTISSPPPVARRPSNIESICDSIDVPYAEHAFSLIDPDKDDERSATASTNSPLTQSELSSASTEGDDEEQVDQVEEAVEDAVECIRADEAVEETGAVVTISSVDYIYEAAVQFSEAVQAEVAADYRGAFARYKSGIATLIQGARHDVRIERQRIAKDKIQKYLNKAERLYEEFIAIDDGGGRIVVADVDDCKEFPIEQLAAYKVIKLVGSVMLVQCRTNHSVFIVKAIERQPSLKFPVNVPYMVALKGYFRSDTNVYLLLQQAG